MKRSTKNSNEKSPVLSLEKALSIIELLAADASHLRLMDISSATGIPSSTALRLLYTLQKHGYVLQDPLTSRYYLSMKLFRLGNQISANLSITELAKPYLKDLSYKTGHSVNLAVRLGDQAVIVDVISNRAEDEIIVTRPGRTVPLYCSALGRAILACLSPEELENYLSEVTFSSFTKLTVSSSEALLQELDQTRLRGYSFDPGEVRNGIIGIGAPITNSHGEAVASISIAELTTAITNENVSIYGNQVADTAKEISAFL